MEDLRAMLEASYGTLEASGGGFDASRSVQEELWEGRAGRRAREIRSLYEDKRY